MLARRLLVGMAVALLGASTVVPVARAAGGGTFGDPTPAPVSEGRLAAGLFSTGDAHRPEAAGSRTMTATPDVDLVDGQEVTVDGAGFGSEQVVGIVQCANGQGINGCGDLGSADVFVTEDDGTFSRTLHVKAVLHTARGDFDCRTYVDGCRLLADSFAGRAKAPLGFDPAGPLEPPPTVAVDPDTDLIDDQVVHVTAAGFRPDETVLIVQCPTGTADPTSTCGGRVTYVQVDGSGNLSSDFQVEAVFTPILGLGDDPYDCRADPCDIGVAASSDYDRFGAASVTFDPDAPLHPEMEVTVTPHTGLVDGQIVQLDGVGYTTNGPVDVVECSISSALDGSGCELDRVQHLTADATGEVTTTYAVNDVLDAGSGDVDCRRSTCILVAVDRSVPIDIGRGYRFENLQFGGGDAPPPSTPADPVTVAPAFTG